MNSKSISILIIAVLFVGAGAFYGGTVYEKSSLAKQNLLRSANGGQDRGNRQGGQGGQQGVRSFGVGQGGPNGANGGFTNGQVISKDDKSITVKTRDGGSKIVFFSDSTLVGKSVSGSASDIADGQQVMVSGKANSDGTITADNIQIRPDMPQNSSPSNQ